MILIRFIVIFGLFFVYIIEFCNEPILVNAMWKYISQKIIKILYML